MNDSHQTVYRLSGEPYRVGSRAGCFQNYRKAQFMHKYLGIWATSGMHVVFFSVKSFWRKFSSNWFHGKTSILISLLCECTVHWPEIALRIKYSNAKDIGGTWKLWWNWIGDWLLVAFQEFLEPHHLLTSTYLPTYSRYVC